MKVQFYIGQYLYIGIRVPIHFVFNVDDEMAATTVELCKYVYFSLRNAVVL